MAILAPSILNSDFLTLGDSVAMLNDSEADWIHLDVMDGSFVPNISFGLPIVAAVKKTADKPLDVHLMIVHPEKYIEDFRKAGADIINVHYEACKGKDLVKTLQDIQSMGAKAAFAVKPDTPVRDILDYAPYADMILMMSVFPGFGGQKFIEDTYDRVMELKAFLIKNSLSTLIQVDGGVSMDNIARLSDVGVDSMVVGSVIFKSDHPSKTIAQLKQLGA